MSAEPLHILDKHAESAGRELLSAITALSIQHDMSGPAIVAVLAYTLGLMVSAGEEMAPAWDAPIDRVLATVVYGRQYGQDLIAAADAENATPEAAHA